MESLEEGEQLALRREGLRMRTARGRLEGSAETCQRRAGHPCCMQCPLPAIRPGQPHFQLKCLQCSGSDAEMSPASSPEAGRFQVFVVSPDCLTDSTSTVRPSAGDPGVEEAQGHCEIPLIASLAGWG